MAVPFSNTKLRVPAGFRNILEGLSREVLRNQPSDIYAFGSTYFDRLIQTRAESGYDPAKVGSWEEDLMYHSEADMKEATPGQAGPISKDEVLAALKIQTKYRQYRAKTLVRRMREMKAALLIQKLFRGYRKRKMLRELRDLSRAEEEKAKMAALAEDEEEEQREGDAPSRILIPDVPDSKQKDAEGPTEAVSEAAEGAGAAAAETAAAGAGDATAEEAKKATDEDEVLVDDIEDAAVRIQAGMRGLLKRKTLSKGLQEGEEEEDEEEGEGTEEQEGEGGGGVQGDAGIDSSVKRDPSEASPLAEENETSVSEGEKDATGETAEEAKQEAILEEE